MNGRTTTCLPIILARNGCPRRSVSPRRPRRSVSPRRFSELRSNSATTITALRSNAATDAFPHCGATRLQTLPHCGAMRLRLVILCATSVRSSLTENPASYSTTARRHYLSSVAVADSGSRRNPLTDPGYNTKILARPRISSSGLHASADIARRLPSSCTA